MPNIKQCFLWVAITVMGTSCENKDVYEPITTATHVSGQQFVDAQSCIECHKDIFESHVKTAHYLTSSLASSNSKLNFDDKDNSLAIGDSLEVKLQEKDSALYHNAYGVTTGNLIDSKQVDVIIGSGTKGRAFTYWQNDSLYQLHASYFTATQSLIKSPGYSAQVKLQNKRPITARCLECHSTYAKTKSVANTFDKSQVLLGIDCQRCHGPAQAHVRFHKNNPKQTEAKFIPVISEMNKQRQIELCALCHSGARKQSLKPRFEYLVGDRLNDFSSPDYFSIHEKLDVHGNQVGLLSASTCFQKSETMTCTTCHNPHENQRNDSGFFVNKCLACHTSPQQVHCGIPEIERNGKNCIACHMPKTISKTMFAKNNITKDTVNVEVISHLIDIYKE